MSPQSLPRPQPPSPRLQSTPQQIPGLKMIPPHPPVPYLMISQVVALQPTPKEAVSLLDLDHRGLGQRVQLRLFPLSRRVRVGPGVLHVAQGEGEAGESDTFRLREVGKDCKNIMIF